VCDTCYVVPCRSECLSSFIPSPSYVLNEFGTFMVLRGIINWEFTIVIVVLTKGSLGYVSMSLLLLCSTSAFPQNRVIKSRQAAILQEVREKLERYFAFPEIGITLSETISEKFKNGYFPEEATPAEFLEGLNKILYEISRDSHLKLIYDPAKAEEMSEGESDTSAADSEIKSERWRNFGFKELMILDGNIGYMNLSDFCSVTYAGEKAVTAMNYFSDCHSLIIDLRQNGGGSDDMVVFLASYFIDSSQPVVFNISCSTIDSAYYVSMMPSYIPGKKLNHIPVYILTSRATASAAEAFLNIMKNYNENVVIVGRKTRGAENPVNHLVVCDEYILRIPSWRKIYSSLNTKWEGRGISPDLDVEESKALAIAHLEALEKLSENASDEEELFQYQWALDGVKGLNDPFPIATDVLESYAGSYSGRRIFYENGELFYGRNKQRLIPVSEDHFLVESVDYFRITFLKEDGKVIAFERNFVYGYSTRHTKNR